MARRVKQGLAAGVVVLLVVLLCTIAPALMTKPVVSQEGAREKPTYDVRLLCSLPEVPSAVPELKRVSPPKLSIELAKSVAFDLLGFSDACTIRADGDHIIIVEGDRVLEFYGLSAIYYSEDMAKYEERSIRLPSREEAVAIAKKFIDQLLARLPALPDGYKLTLKAVGEGYGVMTHAPSGEVLEEKVLSYAVCFSISLNGIETIGPGADAVVCVGDGGRIVDVELYLIWAKPSGQVPIVTPEEAVERLRRGEFYGPALLMPLPKTLVVKHAYLAYYVDNTGIVVPGALQERLEPVYCFDVELKDGSTIVLMVSAVA